MKVSKANIARLARGEQPVPSEDEVQAVIVAGLRALGFIVVITSRRAKRCHGCGAWPKSGRGDGADRGLADLIVRRPAWPAGLCVALEVKRPGPIKWSSDEQRMAALAGDVVVVQSLEEAIAAAEAMERKFE